MRRIRETNLRLLLQVKRMTARELARRVGKSESAISRYARGSREPSVGLALHIASVLGCEIEDVFPT